MQFSYNSDHPGIDSLTGVPYDNNNDTSIGYYPDEFPPVEPIQCTKITTRIYHPIQKKILTVKDVLVRTAIYPTAIQQQSLNHQNQQNQNPNLTNRRQQQQQDSDDESMLSSSSSSSFSDIDDDDDSKTDGVGGRRMTNNSLDGASSGGGGGGGGGIVLDDTNYIDEYAYWTQRTIREAIYGRVLFAIILRKRRKYEQIPNVQQLQLQMQSTGTGTTNTNTSTSVVIPDWIVTDQSCAIKEMSWQHMRKERSRLAEDPIKEVAAMQYFKSCYQQRKLAIEYELQQQQQQQQQQQLQQRIILQNQQLQQQQSVPQSLTAAIMLSNNDTTTTSTLPQHMYDTTTTTTNTSINNPINTTTNTNSIIYDSFTLMNETNVMIPLDLLTDERYLYSIMPFCDGGELFERLDLNDTFTENEARFWMIQILNGLENLQHAGICHRDLSLENLLVHKDTSALIIDMGMCLLLPFEGTSTTATTTTTTTKTNGTTTTVSSMAASATTANNISNANKLANSFGGLNMQQQQQQSPFSPIGAGVVDDNNTDIRFVSRRYQRRYLVKPQGTCGKWIYMSPEILRNKEPFDGYTVDLWAAGVILFLMVTGFPPWERADLTDERFKYMSGGYLVQMMTEWEVGLSSDVLDLLQRMLFYDPKDRLSLDQVRAHPWMTQQQPRT